MKINFSNSVDTNRSKKPIRYDRNGKGNGLLIYFREGAHSKQLTDYAVPNDVEVLAIAITLKKKKWLMVREYRPHPKQRISFLTKLDCI